MSTVLLVTPKWCSQSVQTKRFRDSCRVRAHFAFAGGARLGARARATRGARGGRLAGAHARADGGAVALREQRLQQLALGAVVVAVLLHAAHVRVHAVW